MDTGGLTAKRKILSSPNGSLNKKQELMEHMSNTKLDLWQGAVSKWKPLIMKTRLFLW